jgi:tyrosine-protein phosphatase OCA6
VSFPFLRTLQLRTIISLIPNPITQESDNKLYNFAKSNGIALVHLECAPAGKGKKRGVPMDYPTVVMALNYMVHNVNSPVYIHCYNGGQVTSLVVACLRKLQLWNSISIFNEFINFTTNITVNDRTFVEGFNGEVDINPRDKPDWLWLGISKEQVEELPRIKVNSTS